MSAVEADGTALYSVEVFLAWLKARDMYPLDAHRAGCKEVGPVCRSQSTLSEALAIQWADCLEVEVADIWPEGALEEVKPAPLSLPPGMAASGLTREDFGLRPIREAPGEVRVLATPLVKSETMVKPALGPNAAYCPCPGCEVARTRAGMRSHIRMNHPEADVDAYWPRTEPSHATKPPVALEPCPKCGKGGFVANSGRSAHVAKCKGAVTEGLNMSKRIDKFDPCPICSEPQLAGTGLRNHVRHKHDVDPDTIFGIPEYRSRGPLSAQQNGAPVAPLTETATDPVQDVMALLAQRVAVLEADKEDLERQITRVNGALEALKALA